VLLGPLATLALLLVAAGAAKLRAPGASATALRALGLRIAPVATARALGVAEIGVGAWALATGSPGAALAVATLHLGFAVTTARLLRLPAVPCGCFGAPDAPASIAGLAANVMSVLVAAAATVRPPGPLHQRLLDGPVESGTILVLAVVAAWLVHEIHDALPALETARATAR
jgi:hypothetical protein